MTKGKTDNGDDVIPESLLSIAKDARYVQQCQHLLGEFPIIRNQTTWVISCLLYFGLVVIRTGSTFGMEICGLTFSHDNAINLRKQLTKATTSTYNSTSFSSRVAGFFLLTTAIVRFRYFSSNHSDELDACDTDSNANSNPRKNHEHLKGNSRRLIHERLRRQMLERSKSSAEDCTFDHGFNNADSITPRAFDDQKQNHEGRKRKNVNKNVCHHIDNTEGTTANTKSSKLTRLWLFSFRSVTKFLFDVISNSIDGPHNVTQMTSFSALWLVRLNLARYLMAGKYPTLVHRFLNLNLSRDKTTITNSTIFSRPTTSRTIAFLIFSQFATSIIQTSANSVAKIVANYLESRCSFTKGTSVNNRQYRLLIHKRLHGIFNSTADFKQQPTKQSFEQGTQHQLQYCNYCDSNSAKLAFASETIKSKKTICTICRRFRRHPAASLSCGHVCCWDCWIQWVSTVRPECPLCRSPCKAQDIIALYNYDPSS